MCRKCSDHKIIVPKQDEFRFFRYNFVILVLFSLTCSSLGLSCYAVLRVQNLSEDLNVLRLVLAKNKVASLSDGKFRDQPNWGDNPERIDDESPLLQKLFEGSNTFSGRTRRSLQSKNFKFNDPGYSRVTKNETFRNATEQAEEGSKVFLQRLSSNNGQNVLHNIKKKAVDIEENLESETFTPDYQVQHNVYRHKHRERNNNQLEIIDEFSPQAGRLKSLMAIHFNGDTSKYVYGRHSNFNGNGHLRHPKRTFVDWKESDWGETISTGSGFGISDGVVNIKEAGLYFVYAQIYYLDVHDTNGYRVYRNSDTLLQCTTTSHSTERMTKGNTCYTAGVTYLNTNDGISISDIMDGRYSLFEPGKSFFGIIKLGDVKIK